MSTPPVYTKIDGKVYKHSLKASELIGATLDRMRMSRNYLEKNQLDKLKRNQEKLASCIEGLFTEMSEVVGECEMSFDYTVLDFVRKKEEDETN